jgi:tetratricopeptide (TPR) repeat protein
LRAQLAAAQAADNKPAIIELARRIVESAPEDRKAWETLIRTGLEFLETDRCAAWLDEWQRRAKSPPVVIEELRGDVCLDREDFAGAEQYWRAFLNAKVSPGERALTLGKLADLFVKQKRWADVADARNRAVVARDTPANRAAFAAALLHLHRWDAAYAEMRRANARDPSDDTVKEWLPQFERLSAYLPRIKAADAQIAKQPANVPGLLDRARLFTLGDQPLLALDDGERAMSLSVESMRARMQTAESLLDLDRAEDAAKLQVSKKLARGAENHVSEAALDSLSAADTAIAKNARDVDALVKRAKVLRDLNQFTLALADAQAALAVDDNLAAAHFEAAHALDALERTSEAVAQIRRASELNANEPVIWYYRGVLEAGRANYTGAVDAQSRSLALHESLVALHEREECERRIGKVAEADADLRRINELAPQR